MRKEITWLHLSDLHFRKGDQYECNVVLDSLIEDIASLKSKHKINLDCIFITGDIAFSGKKEEYGVAENFISRLLDVSNVKVNNVFCVPGNHDIDRALSSPLTKPLLTSLNNRERITDIIGTPNKVSLFTQRHKAFNDFLRSTFPWAKKYVDSDLSFTENLNINGTKISIIGLNSAWVSDFREDKGHIIIGERQARQALKQVNNPDLVISMFHHPLSYLSDFDEIDVRNILNRRCDFLLHGHVHNMGVINVVDPDSEVFYLAAGATYSSRREILSYNCVTVSMDKGKAKVYLRRYSDTGNMWHTDNAMYSSAPNGIFEFSLPERLSHKPQPVDISSVKKRISEFVPQQKKQVVSIEIEPATPLPPESLIASIKNKNCILFAGAGASVDAKLPTWSELVAELVEQVIVSGTIQENEYQEVKDLLNQKEYLVLAAYCRNRLGEFDFAEYLKERLSCDNRLSRTHRLLAAIPFCATITSNFDAFLEHSRANAKVILPEMMDDAGASGVKNIINSTIFPVIKIHGTFDKKDSIILTRKDFRELLFSKPKYRDFLTYLFTDYTVFFYGYSFNDPNIDFCLQQIMAIYGGNTRPHYALMPDPGRIKQEYLRNEYNIRVIPYDCWNSSHIIASNFLQSVINECK